MYERSYGYLYDHERYQNAAEIAAQIRQDIKRAIAEGLLPGEPVKYSVRSDNFSGGRSIDIQVQNWPEAWQDCPGYVPGTRRPFESGGGWTATPCGNVWCKAGGQYRDMPGAQTHQVLTEEAQAALMTLERIHTAYNHDGSDSMVDHFDVNYYGQVTFEDARHAEFRATEAAKMAARRQAIGAAAQGERKRVVVYGRQGKRTVHDAVEVGGRIKLVCGATLWSHSFTGDATGHELTCSRCKKRAAS